MKYGRYKREIKNDKRLFQIWKNIEEEKKKLIVKNTLSRNGVPIFRPHALFLSLQNTHLCMCIYVCVYWGLTHTCHRGAYARECAGGRTRVSDCGPGVSFYTNQSPTLFQLSNIATAPLWRSFLPPNSSFTCPHSSFSSSLLDPFFSVSFSYDDDDFTKLCPSMELRESYVCQSTFVTIFVILCFFNHQFNHQCCSEQN